MTDELKRCPFCGGEPKVFHHQNKWVGETWHIECLDDNCGCGTCHHDSAEIAATVWNRRLPLGLQTEIDYLESEIEERDAKIEHLRDKIERLRKALRNTERVLSCAIGNMEAHKECDECQQSVGTYHEAVVYARAALGKTE